MYSIAYLQICFSTLFPHNCNLFMLVSSDTEDYKKKQILVDSKRRSRYQ